MKKKTQEFWRESFELDNAIQSQIPRHQEQTIKLLTFVANK